MDQEVFEAAESGDFNSVLEVLNGLELDELVTPHKKDTVLHVAIRSGNMKFAEKALGHCPKLVTTPNSGGETPLHAAARTGEAEMVGLILGASDDVEDSGAMLRARDADACDTALHVAIRHGFSAVAELLLGRHMVARPPMDSPKRKAGREA